MSSTSRFKHKGSTFTHDEENCADMVLTKEAVPGTPHMDSHCHTLDTSLSHGTDARSQSKMTQNSCSNSRQLNSANVTHECNNSGGDGLKIHTQGFVVRHYDNDSACCNVMEKRFTPGNGDGDRLRLPTAWDEPRECASVKPVASNAGVSGDGMESYFNANRHLHFDAGLPNCGCVKDAGKINDRSSKDNSNEQPAKIPIGLPYSSRHVQTNSVVNTSLNRNKKDVHMNRSVVNERLYSMPSVQDNLIDHSYDHSSLYSNGSDVSSLCVTCNKYASIDDKMLCRNCSVRNDNVPNDVDRNRRDSASSQSDLDNTDEGLPSCDDSLFSLFPEERSNGSLPGEHDNDISIGNGEAIQSDMWEDHSNSRRPDTGAYGLSPREFGAGIGIAVDAIDEDFIDADIPNSNLYFDKDSTASEDEQCSEQDSPSSGISNPEMNFPESNFLNGNSSRNICDMKSKFLCKQAHGLSQVLNHTNISRTQLPNVSGVSRPSSSKRVTDNSFGPTENQNLDKNDLNIRNDVKSIVSSNEVANDLDSCLDNLSTVLSDKRNDADCLAMGSVDVRQKCDAASACKTMNAVTATSMTRTVVSVNSCTNSQSSVRTVVTVNSYTNSQSSVSSPLEENRKVMTNSQSSYKLQNSQPCNRHKIRSTDGTASSQSTSVTKSAHCLGLSSSSDEEMRNKPQKVKRNKSNRHIYPKPDFGNPPDSSKLPPLEFASMMARVRRNVWRRKGRVIDYNHCCTGIPHYPKVPRAQRFKITKKESEKSEEEYTESSTDEEYYEPVPEIGSKKFLQYHYRRRALAEEKGDTRTCECKLCLPKQEDYPYNIEEYAKPWPDYVESIIVPCKKIEDGDKDKPNLTLKDSRWAKERDSWIVSTDPTSVSGCMERKLFVNLDSLEKKDPYDSIWYNPCFVWNEDEVRNIQVNQIGTSACGPTAALNVLKAFDYEITAEEINALIPVKRRDEKAPIPDYLFTRSCAGTTAQDIIEGIELATDGEIAGRFFHTYPERNFKCQKWINEWLRNGAVCIVTLNLQRGRMWGRPIPDAWHHQMVYGVNSAGVHLTNPVEFVTDYVLHNKLSSDSVLLVRSSDVIARWQPENSDLRKLMNIQSDPRWTSMNVLGQVVNVMRQHTHSLPTNRRAHVPSHVSIPAVYKAGISVFIPRGSRSYHTLMREPELPILTEADEPLYKFSEYDAEPEMFKNFFKLSLSSLTGSSASAGQD